MKNKMLLGIAALFTLSSLAFGEVVELDPAETTLQVNIQIISPITITLTANGVDGDTISFGNVPNTTTDKINALNNVEMSVLDAYDGAEIAFYLSEVGENKDTADIALAGTGNPITANLSLSEETDIVADGKASTTISASIAAGGITTGNTAGNYHGTIQVFAEYN